MLTGNADAWSPCVSPHLNKNKEEARQVPFPQEASGLVSLHGPALAPLRLRRRCAARRGRRRPARARADARVLGAGVRGRPRRGLRRVRGALRPQRRRPHPRRLELVAQSGPRGVPPRRRLASGLAVAVLGGALGMVHRMVAPSPRSRTHTDILLRCNLVISDVNGNCKVFVLTGSSSSIHTYQPQAYCPILATAYSSTCGARRAGTKIPFPWPATGH